MTIWAMTTTSLKQPFRRTLFGSPAYRRRASRQKAAAREAERLWRKIEQANRRLFAERQTCEGCLGCPKVVKHGGRYIDGVWK